MPRWSGFSEHGVGRGSDALFEGLARGGRGEAEQPVEGIVQVSWAVSAEDELGEIAVGVALPETLECALRPAPEVEGNGVDAMQQLGRPAALDPRMS